MNGPGLHWPSSWLTDACPEAGLVGEEYSSVATGYMWWPASCIRLVTEPVADAKHSFVMFDKPPFCVHALNSVLLLTCSLWLREKSHSFYIVVSLSDTEMLSPRGQSGLGAKILASASNIWPRPGLGLQQKNQQPRRDRRTNLFALYFAHYRTSHWTIITVRERMRN